MPVNKPAKAPEANPIVTSLKNLIKPNQINFNIKKQGADHRLKKNLKKWGEGQSGVIETVVF